MNRSSRFVGTGLLVLALSSCGLLGDGSSAKINEIPDPGPSVQAPMDIHREAPCPLQQPCRR